MSWQKIFQESPIGIAIVDLNNKFIKVNTVFCRILEYSEAELLQKKCCEITHSDDINADHLMRYDLSTGKISNYEMVKRFITKTGKTIWTNFYVSSLTKGGVITGYVCHIRLIEAEENITVRPKVNFIDFVVDNWQWFLSATGVICSVIIGLSVFFYITKHDLKQQTDKVILKYVKY